jgi:glucokinase
MGAVNGRWNEQFVLSESGLMANVHAMNLLGIDIGGTKTSVCIGDEQGLIRASRRISTQIPNGPETCIQHIVDLSRSLLDDSKLERKDVTAVGISAPGPVSVSKGLMLAPPNMPGWVNVPVVQRFQDAFQRPVFMNNDANACALAEYRFGACRGVANLVYLTMSTGLGAGFVANGKIVQGITDTGGEVGHHVLDIHGPPCPCGQRGCWEIYCGGRNVANRLREYIVTRRIQTAILDQAGGDPDQIDFKAFVEAVKRNDPFAEQAWRDYIERLAQGIGTVIQFMNPEVILMGTIAIHAGDLLFAPLRKALPRYAWKPGVEACRLLPSSLGARIGDLSALAVAIDNLQAVANATRPDGDPF